jgi:hypothetical protein
MTGELPINDVDHKNRDRGDCRWENLRPATRSQNNANSIPQAHNKLGVKGVYREGSKFVARIKVNGRGKRLGSFPSASLAAYAYKAAAVAAFGEFARLS